jgi:hypothetical protein
MTTAGGCDRPPPSATEAVFAILFAIPSSTLQRKQIERSFHLPMIQARACLFLDRVAMDVMVVDLMAVDAIG